MSLGPEQTMLGALFCLPYPIASSNVISSGMHLEDAVDLFPAMRQWVPWGAPCIFWSILQFELSAYDSTSPTVAFGYPWRAFRVRFRRFPEQGRVLLAMSGPKRIRRPTVLPIRGGAGAVTLQNTPFFARARMGYLGRIRRYPVNIYNLYRNLYKTKRQTA